MKYLLLVFLAIASPVALSSESFEAAENFRSALSAFKEKNFYSARLLLQEIVLKEPRGDLADDAQYYLAMTYYYEGDYKTAQFEFRALGRDFPESPFVVRAEFWNGEAWFYRKAYREAIESHNKFIRKYRENTLCASALYTIGYIYNDQKRYDEAVEVLSRALKEYPDTTPAPALTLQLGIAHFNSGDFKLARRSFQTLIVKFAGGGTDNIDSARFWLAKSHYAEKNFEIAEREFLAVVKDFPESQDAAESLYLAALCRYKVGALPAALALIDEVAQKYPKSKIYPFARLRQAQLFVESGKNAAALAPILDIINNHQAHETFAPALDLLAQVRKQQGKTAEAIQSFEALRQDKALKPPAQRQLLRRYGDALYEESRFTAASEIYRELVEAETDTERKAEAELLLARALYRDQKYDAALASLKNLSEGSSHAEASLLKAEISYALGKFTEALQSFARFAKKYPEHPKVFDAEMGIGWTYFELKQYARAADNFRKILKRFKNPAHQARALLALGNALYNLRDFSGAEAAYTKIIRGHFKEKVEADEALYQLGWLKFRLGEFAAAEKTLTTYARLGEPPRKAEAEFFLAQSLFQLGDFKRAESLLTELYASGRAQGALKERILPDLGKARIQIGNTVGARDAYQLYLQDFPNGSLSGEVRHQIAAVSLKLGDELQATQILEYFEKNDPKSPWHKEVLVELASFYRKKKDFIRATDCLKKAEILSEKREEKYEKQIARAEILAEDGRGDEARSLLANILKVEDLSEPIALKAGVTLFQIFEKSADYKAGDDWAEKLTQRYADSAKFVDEILVYQGRLRYLDKNYRGAREVLSALAKSRSVGSRAKLLIAQCFLSEGDNDRALDYFRQVSPKDDAVSWTKARFHVGEILFERKNFDEAAREFSRIAYAESRDGTIYEKSLYFAARSFRELKKNKEYLSFREKLVEAFPRSLFLKELPPEGTP